MVRVLTGLIKGVVLGAAVGFGAQKLGLGSGPTAYLVQAIVGAVVGFVCGKPPWRQETIWTSVTKAIFGGVVALGLTWLARKFLGGLTVPLPTALGVVSGTPLVQVPLILGAALGGLWGLFVEVDDGGGPSKADDKAVAKG